MNLNQIFTSTSLKASDFETGEEKVLTISGIEIRDIGPEGQKESKPVLSFTEIEQGLVLNKTNGNIIAQMYGDKNIDVVWKGKPITLRVEQTTFQGKAMPGIRVKLTNPDDAIKASFWKKADEMALSPTEARAILKENGMDFKRALAAMSGVADDIDADFPPIDAPDGNITPAMLVEHGIASDVAKAAKIVNDLGVAGKVAAEFWPRVLLYGAHVRSGAKHEVAVTNAISGNIPQA